VTRFTTPSRQALQHDDAIENIESSFEGPTHDSIETEEQDLELGDLSGDEHNIAERSLKRRRLSSSSQLEESKEATEPDSFPLVSSPPPSRRPISSTAPRFLLSTPLPPSTPQAPPATQPFLKPPRFKSSDPAEQTQTDPLPEQFSPHRRGQKYVPGGLAAEVRDWLVNLESAILGTSAQRVNDDWVVRIEVDEVRGGGRAGMTLVRGRQINGDGKVEVVNGFGVVRVILAGEGAGSALLRGGTVQVGKMVGIRGPVWEVLLEGEKWGVGVDWKVLP
jgi:hypothetical protein